MSRIYFSRSGSPREKKYDVVNYQSDEGWVKVITNDEDPERVKC